MTDIQPVWLCAEPWPATMVEAIAYMQQELLRVPEADRHLVTWEQNGYCSGCYMRPETPEETRLRLIEEREYKFRRIETLKQELATLQRETQQETGS